MWQKTSKVYYETNWILNQKFKNFRLKKKQILMCNSDKYSENL